MQNNNSSSTALLTGIMLLAVSSANAWAGINLFAMNVVFSAKLFNDALDFEKLKIISLWSVLPLFVSILIAVFGLSMFPELKLLILVVGGLYSMAVFYGGVNQISRSRLTAIISPLVMPVLLAAIVAVST